MVPLAVAAADHLQAALRRPDRGGADGDRGPGHADPGGPGAADERHLRRRRRAPGPSQDARPADERDREPRLGRHDLRRQDRDADRRRAAPARSRGRRGCCGGRRPRALGAFAASAGEHNRTLGAIAEHFQGKAERVGGEVPFSSEWKWSGLRIGGKSYVMGAPDVLERAGALSLSPASAMCSSAKPPTAGASSPSASRARRSPPRHRARGRPRCRRWRWSCSKRRCGPTPRRRSPSCASRTST